MKKQQCVEAETVQYIGAVSRNKKLLLFRREVFDSIE